MSQHFQIVLGQDPKQYKITPPNRGRNRERFVAPLFHMPKNALMTACTG